MKIDFQELLSDVAALDRLGSPGFSLKFPEGKSESEGLNELRATLSSVLGKIDEQVGEGDDRRGDIMKKGNSTQRRKGAKARRLAPGIKAAMPNHFVIEKYKKVNGAFAGFLGKLKKGSRVKSLRVKHHHCVIFAEDVPTPHAYKPGDTIGFSTGRGELVLRCCEPGVKHDLLVDVDPGDFEYWDWIFHHDGLTGRVLGYKGEGKSQ
jgi:hypothetical protein